MWDGRLCKWMGYIREGSVFKHLGTVGVLGLNSVELQFGVGRYVFDVIFYLFKLSLLDV